MTDKSDMLDDFKAEVAELDEDSNIIFLSPDARNWNISMMVTGDELALALALAVFLKQYPGVAEKAITLWQGGGDAALEAMINEGRREADEIPVQ